MKKILKTKKLFLLASLLFFVFLFHQNVLATNNSKIYFIVPSSDVPSQSNFTVSILLDTDQPINAFELEVKYPKDKIQFLDSLNTHSIVDIWSGKPKLMQNGDIHLSGGLNKPFIGSKGLVINLIFKALNPGVIDLSFDKSDVYIADGKGTKLNLDKLASTININKSVAQSTTPEQMQVIDASGGVDSTPPEILLKETISPVDGAKLISFQAIDQESGIKNTQMRIKKWWRYSEWQEVQNPVLYPKGVWSLELKATNNFGLESVKSLQWTEILIKKIIGVIILLLALVFVVFKLYNGKKRNL